MNPLFTKLSSKTVTRLTPALHDVKFDAARGLVTGYASTFGNPPDAYGDVIAAGAFKQTLADLKTEDIMPPMLWSHDPAEPIGSWKEMREDANGLLVRGQLNLETERGKEIHSLLKNGDVSGLSIGFMIPKDGYRFQTDGTRLIREIELVEISVVTLPANRRARISGVKSLQNKRELETLLRDVGLPRAAAAKLAAGGWPALSGKHIDQTTVINLAARIDRATANIKG